MARTFKAVTVGGHKYQIGQLGARAARDVALLVIEHNGVTLAGLHGQSVAAFGAAMASSAKSMRDPAYWTGVVAPLFEQVLTEKNESLITVYDDHFIGRLGQDLEVLAAAIEHNCGGFIEAFSRHATTSLATEKAGEPGPGLTGTPGVRS